MEWLAFLLGGSLGQFLGQFVWAVLLGLGSRHANGDPACFSQYHSGFFKAGVPIGWVCRKIPSPWSKLLATFEDRLAQGANRSTSYASQPCDFRIVLPRRTG